MRRVTVVRGRGGRLGEGGKRTRNSREGRKDYEIFLDDGGDNYFVLEYEEGDEEFPGNIDVEDAEMTAEGGNKWEHMEEAGIDILLDPDIKIQQELLEDARKEVKFVCERIRRKAGVTSNTEVSVESLLNIFLPR